MKDKKFYLNIIITIVISYVLIKFIDNYGYFVDLFRLLLSLLTPFVIAFILAYILNPIVGFFDKKLHMKRIFSLLVTYGIILIILGLSIVFTTPVIISSIADIVNDVPRYMIQTQDFLLEIGNSLKNIDPQTLKEIGDTIFNAIPDISMLLIGSVGDIFNTTFSVTKFLAQFVLAFIICFYILLEKENFGVFSKKFVHVAFGKHVGETFIDVCKTLNINIGKYFVSKFVDSFIVGMLSAIALAVVGSQYALLFGTFMCFMNLIPYFGPVIGMTPVVIINLFYDPQVALFSLLALLIVQQIEIAIIEPKIVGGQLGLSPFLTILAVTVGGGLFGIPGMILSVPIMGVIKIYFSRFLDSRYKKL